VNIKSVLKPASAARRIACPGSRALEELYPQDSSPSAKEGAAAHWLAAEILGGCELIDMPDTAPNGEYITQEMVDGAELYKNAVHSDMTFPRPKPPTPSVYIERPLDLSCVYPSMWGTPDAWHYEITFGGHRNIFIYDYKFGHGIIDAFENWQLIEYAAGIFKELDIDGINDRKTIVKFVIVQPRSYHRDGTVRSWTITGDNLRPYFNIVSAAESDSMSADARCNPSPQCNHCSARHACQALQRSALNAVDVSTSNIPWDLSPSQVGAELRYLQHAAKLLAARISGLSEEALATIRRGESVPGFRAEHSAGREVWKMPDSEVVALGAMFDLDLAKPTEVITPKQAVKMGFPKDIAQDYSEVHTGALRLVPEDGATARKIFGGGK
jgi:hypothetical protein